MDEEDRDEEDEEEEGRERGEGDITSATSLLVKDPAGDGGGVGNPFGDPDMWPGTPDTPDPDDDPDGDGAPDLGTDRESEGMGVTEARGYGPDVWGDVLKVLLLLLLVVVVVVIEVDRGLGLGVGFGVPIPPPLPIIISGPLT